MLERCALLLFFCLNAAAPTEIYTLHIVGSVRCVQETVLDALDERAHQPEDAVEPEEAEGEAHHDHEVKPHPMQQGIAGGIVIIRVRLKFGETGGGVSMAFAARLGAVLLVQAGVGIVNPLDVVGPMAVAAAGGAHGAQRGRLSVVTAAVGLVEGGGALAILAGLIVALPTFGDDVALEGGSVGARNGMCGVTVIAHGRLGVSLGNFLPVDAGRVGFRQAYVALAAGDGHLGTDH
eukprot:TRINITY_DN19637_c0_g1_i1.p2 TRINITY_DN19637_c0_g1~~TRINITY_DN19637_c0_g1_i1.p2  ORF type:complete len:235 (+),score=20.74 TRINITY_DN19637_c0_g1_i1:3-707(+)